MLGGRVVSNNEKQKIKMKKNALEFVDIESEKKLDPKYKTEMCKSWNDTGSCVYGNKCRFAHGRNELFGKPVSKIKYKQKECSSFKETGVCMYGTRCNFKHDERSFQQIERSFYEYSLANFEDFSTRKNLEKVEKAKRLRVFEHLTQDYNMSSNVSGNTSTSSRSPVNFKNSARFLPLYHEAEAVNVNNEFMQFNWSNFRDQKTNQCYYPNFQPIGLY